MKVLVTGASGFVGQWLVKELLAEGVEVRELRRKSSSSERPDPRIEVALGDVTNLESVENATRDMGAVFHLAGHVGYSRAERATMEAINVDGTANVVRACVKSKVPRLVHMSSVVAVGASTDGVKPLTEESPYNLEHLDLGYFETKHKAERLVKEAVTSGKLDAVILNPSTIYGAGDAAKGSRKVQLKVARGRFPFYTSGGVSVVAVEDVVKATIAAWRRGRSGERYILSGENLTIREVVSLIATSAGVPPPRRYVPNPVVRLLGAVGDGLEKIGRKGPLNSETAWTAILYHWFNHEKATRELGFSPAGAKESIARSVGWMKTKGLIN
jgi:dihydroflavonol-4-reductase